MQEIAHLTTTSLLALAGSARLPSDLVVSEKVADDTTIMQDMEIAIQQYIKENPEFRKSLHDKAKKAVILRDIHSIIDSFDCAIKNDFKRLWEIFLTDSTDKKEIKELITKITQKVSHKKTKDFIETNMRNESKYTSVIKTILNIQPPFQSIFFKDTLTKAEQIATDNNLRLNLRFTERLDTFVEVVDFGAEDSENKNVSMFFETVHRITDPKLRTQYFNLYLKKIISKLTIKIGTVTKAVTNSTIENIFVQIYLYLTNMETIKTVDPAVVAYLKLKTFDWFTYQIQNHSDIMYPNWNFKKRGFKLDEWQKQTILNIGQKKNILLSLPTSAGKTIISTYIIRKYSKVAYIVPSEALAYQLTGIILASRLDIENKDQECQNIRLETKSMNYKRYPDKKDDVIVATPEEFYKLISTKVIDPHFDYIILDEFHNITSDIGCYFEYILKFAGYFSIPVVCLSATIPNYDAVKTWLSTILRGDVFGVHEIKRFFNQKRMVIKGLDLVPVNVLDNITPEIIKSPDFTHIGLYPKQIFDMYTKLPIPRVDERDAKVVTLDRMFKMELDIFEYLKTLSDEELVTIVKDNKINTEQLTMWELYKIIKLFQKRRITPAIIFKMDSDKCMEIFTKMLDLLMEYQSLVYPNFRRDQVIVQEFFDIYNKAESKIEAGGDIEKAREKLKDSIFTMTKQKLDECYEEFIMEGMKAPEEEPKPKKKAVAAEEEIEVDILTGEVIQNTNKTVDDESDEEDDKYDPIKEFNKKYGANLTREEIIALRRKFVKHQQTVYSSPDGLVLYNIFTPHEDCRFSSSSVSFDDMRKIRRRIQAEITRETRVKHGFKAPVARIDYKHPFMLGVEHGLLCYNEKFDSAFQRVTQQLINTGHNFVTISDKSLAVGINYPIKTVMLLGGLKGEPIEILDNTIAHQAMGRAGRRGLDSEGFIVYSGIDIADLLAPRFTPVTRNSREKMEDLLTTESTDFKRFILDEIYPAIPEELWSVEFALDIDSMAHQLYIIRSINGELGDDRPESADNSDDDTPDEEPETGDGGDAGDADAAGGAAGGVSVSRKKVKKGTTLEDIKEELRQRMEFAKFKRKEKAVSVKPAANIANINIYADEAEEDKEDLPEAVPDSWEDWA